MGKKYGMEGVTEKSGSDAAKPWKGTGGKMQGRDEKTVQPPEKTAGSHGSRDDQTSGYKGED